jgi:uncharacterized protein YaaQ
MLGLSDRDSKIILVLLIIAIVVLPYVLYTKNLRADTELIKSENVDLKARLEELQEMNKNREFYIAETERMQKERDELIASFPAEIGQENYTMFLQYLEVNSILKANENELAMQEDDDDETPPFGYKGIEGNTTFLIGSVGYNDNDYIQIGEDSDSNLMGVINDSTLAFKCYYDGFRYMLDYILNYEDPMIYKNLKVEYDPDSGQLEGEMMIEQWAIAGNGRKLDPVPVFEDIDELDMRGLDTNLFGPLSPDSLYKHQVFELYLEELGEEEEDEEAGEGEGLVIE